MRLKIRENLRTASLKTQNLLVLKEHKVYLYATKKKKTDSAGIISDAFETKKEHLATGTLSCVVVLMFVTTAIYK